MKRFSHPFMHLLVLAAWSLVMMVVALFLGVAFGISDTESLTHSHNNAFSFLLWNVVVQLLTFALPVVLVTRRYYRETQGDFYRLDFSRRSWMLALAGVLVLLFMVPLTDWLSIWNDSWHFSGAWEKLEHSLREAGEQSQQLVDSLMRECNPLLSLFGMAFVPAICEELFFRVGIQNLLQKWFKNPHAAVWVTAALFSLAHGEVFAFLPRFLLGGLLGYLYFYGSSLLVNVVAHFINNAIVVVAYALMSDGGSSLDPSQPLAVPLLATIACTAAAIALFWFAYLRHQPHGTSEL
jgi:membrane protease YdiL (CAAX protease family)